MELNDEEVKYIIDFLKWNDKNGDFNLFSKDDAIIQFFSTVNADLLKDNPLSYELKEIYSIAKEKNLYFSTMVKLNFLIENKERAYSKLIQMI